MSSPAVWCICNKSQRLPCAGNLSYWSRGMLGTFPSKNLLLQKIILDKRRILSASDIKSFLIMMLKGLEYLHDRWILHRVCILYSMSMQNEGSFLGRLFDRSLFKCLEEYDNTNWWVAQDLKPGNMLLSADGVLRIADFGLATEFGSPDRRYTSQAVTMYVWILYSSVSATALECSIHRFITLLLYIIYTVFA